MKKVIGLVGLFIMTLAILPAQAQLRFGVKGGVNISSVHLSDIPENWSSSNVTGFHVGPMLEMTVPLLGVGLETAVLYTQKGMELKTGDQGITESIKLDYIDIPVHLKWKFGLPIVKVYLATGPYFDFRVGGDKIWKVMQNQIEAKTFGVGWDFGGGVEVLNHLQVGLNYGLGFNNNYSVGDKSDGKNRGWMITAAILF